MGEAKAVTVSSETYQQMRRLRDRLAATDPHRLTAVFAPLLERGASLSSVVTVGVALLEEELNKLTAPVVLAEIKPTPKPKRPKALGDSLPPRGEAPEGKKK